MGHIARLMEENGIATVVIGSGVFRSQMESMSIPRSILTRFPMGRTLGAPGDRQTQRMLILEALDLLENASRGGVVRESSLPYRIGL